MFKIGQRVICIDDSPCVTLPALKLNKIYTIRALSHCNTGVQLEEQGGPTRACFCHVCHKLIFTENSYNLARFAPIDETFAEEVLAKVAEEIEEEQLVRV
jgi:hypothetical protein